LYPLLLLVQQLSKSKGKPYRLELEMVARSGQLCSITYPHSQTNHARELLAHGSEPRPFFNPDPSRSSRSFIHISPHHCMQLYAICPPFHHLPLPKLEGAVTGVLLALPMIKGRGIPPVSLGLRGLMCSGRMTRRAR